MPVRMSDLIRQTVEAHSRRDEDLVENYEMLMRITPNNPNRPNRQSCDLVDQITFEHFLALFATVRAARTQRPYWLFEAIEAGEEQSAQRVEKGLTIRAARDGFDAALYDADWIALRDAVAPMYIGWTERMRNVRSLRYRAVDDEDPDNLVLAEHRDPEVQYDEVPYLEPAVERVGFDFRVPDRGNFYMNPPESKDVDDAIGLGYREYWTANRLLEAIEDYDFDKDEVYELLRLGPTGYDDKGDYHESRSEVSGTTTQNRLEDGIGYWELFFWFGKLPVWTKNGGIEVPDYLRRDEFLWVVCPRYEKILRFSYSPYAIRPFTLFRMLREPGGQGGESVPTITGAYQEEGTAIVRAGIDGMNLRTMPVMKRLAANEERFGVQVLSPGGTILCERSLNEIEPITWNMAQAHETMAWLADVRSRAKGVMSGAGYGELPQKVRKQAEVEAAVAGVSAKMSLFVANLQASGMERAALIMLSHLGQFGQKDGETYLERGQAPVKVDAEDWKRVYVIRPRGTAADADPSVRLERKRYIMETLRNSPIYQMMIQAGDMRPEYHALRELLTAMDEPNAIESYFGEEPPPPDYMQVAAQVMAQVYQASTNLPVDPQVFMQNPAMRAVMMALVQQGQRPASPMENVVGAEPQAAMNGAGAGAQAVAGVGL